MIDYKKTLLMPSTGFEMKANLNQKEPLIQQQWIYDNIYELTLQKNRNNEQFILHDGPPYANGDIHVGHALNKIIKDIIIRYKLISGNYAPIIYGWDTHGLPIENAIAKKSKDFETISDPVEKRKKCRQYALEQVNKQQNQFARLGLLTNWEKKYLTLDNSFIMDELYLFLKMVERKLVFQDFKPVYWSWSTKSALAEAEIEYKEVVDPSIYICFKIAEENAIIPINTNLIIWTTTPWTIPSNLAIAVNPNFEYSLIKYKNEHYLIAKNLMDKIVNKLGFNNEYELIKNIDGKDLENLKYNHPFYNRKSPIILAEYVSDQDGTGLVHNAPGFGLDDYYACKKYGIEVFCPIDDNGKFDNSINDNELQGVFYTKANEIIIDRLRKNNSLLLVENITHSVAHDWRSKKPVMYRATKQWFVNISAISNEIEKNLDLYVSSYNKKTIERIKEMVLKRKEWCISRQRVWGVPIPIIFDENREPIYNLSLINHIINIFQNEGIDVWFEKEVDYFIPKWMDRQKKYYKEKDIIDVWFDSGSSFNILKHYNLHYPADLYFEGSDQFRGWFNSSLINGIIMNNKTPYSNLLQHGFVLDEKGNKMSKSLGNTVDPLKICNEYGADVLRIWATTNDYSSDLRIGDNIIKQSAETYRKIRNTLLRYSLSNLFDFDPDKDLVNEFRIEDLYVLDKLNSLIESSNQNYNEYNFINIIKDVSNFTIDLSQWYFEIIKDELYCGNKDSIVRKQIQSTIFIILLNVLIILNPIIPHTCEEAYSFLNMQSKKKSIMLESFPKKLDFKINNNIKNMMKDFFKLKDEIYVAIEEARNQSIIKKSNEATIITNNNYNIKEETLAKWLNVAEVIIDQNVNKIQIINKNYKKCLRCWNHFKDNDMANEEICIRCNTVINN